MSPLLDGQDSFSQVISNSVRPSDYGYWNALYNISYYSLTWFLVVGDITALCCTKRYYSMQSYVTAKLWQIIIFLAENVQTDSSPPWKAHHPSPQDMSCAILQSHIVWICQQMTRLHCKLHLSSLEHEFLTDSQATSHLKVGQSQPKRYPILKTHLTHLTSLEWQKKLVHLK